MLWLFPLLFAISYAHICSIYPPQRGDLNLSDPGDPTCYWRTPYCGGKVFSGKTTAFLAGSEAQFLIQQNLNHWNATNPGFIDVAISYSSHPTDDDWTVLATISDYPAFDQVTQTNFTLTVTLPTKPVPRAILRFRYQSNNLDEVDHNTTIFYNCADIQLIANPNLRVQKATKRDDIHDEKKESEIHAEASNKANFDEKKESSASKKNQRPIDDDSCSTPPYWRVSALEVFTNGHETVQHQFYYDAARNRTAWFRTTWSGKVLWLINDYNKLIEYVIDPVGRTCEQYGSDHFYHWEYGVSGMTLSGTFNTIGSSLDTWTSPSGNIVWTSEQLRINGEDFCKPISHVKPFSTMTFSAFNMSRYSDSAFNPPQYCFGRALQKKAGCSPRKLAVSP